MQDACMYLVKDPVLSIMHCALQKIGGHFLDVEKSGRSYSSL